MAREFSRSDYITALALQEQARLERSQPSSSHHPRQHPAHHDHQHMALPIPDLRFEQTYLKRVGPYVHVQRRGEGKGKGKEGDIVQGGNEEVVTVEWGKVIWITTRDQVISPLVQGALWGTASLFLRPMAAALGTRLRQWWPSESPKAMGREGKGIGYLRSIFGGLLNSVPGIAK